MPVYLQQHASVPPATCQCISGTDNARVTTAAPISMSPQWLDLEKKQKKKKKKKKKKKRRRRRRRRKKKKTKKEEEERDEKKEEG